MDGHADEYHARELRLMILALAQIVISWWVVTLDCNGMNEMSQPVTYLMPLWTGEMARNPICPADELGQAQDCAVWTLIEVDTGQANTYSVPDPPIGKVYATMDPVAVDAAGNRSDDSPCL